MIHLLMNHIDCPPSVSWTDSSATDSFQTEKVDYEIKKTTERDFEQKIAMILKRSGLFWGKYRK